MNNFEISRKCVNLDSLKNSLKKIEADELNKDTELIEKMQSLVLLFFSDGGFDFDPNTSDDYYPNDTDLLMLDNLIFDLTKLLEIRKDDPNKEKELEYKNSISEERRLFLNVTEKMYSVNNFLVRSSQITSNSSKGFSPKGFLSLGV